MASEYFTIFDAVNFNCKTFLLCFTRIQTLLIVTPAFGGYLLQGKIRIAVAVILALVSSPQTRPQGDVELISLFCLLLKEAVLGFLIGFITSIVFYGIQSSGTFLDCIRGDSISQIFVSQAGNKESPFAQIYFQITIITFFATNSHLAFIRAIHFGFLEFPVFEYPSFFYDQHYAYVIKNVIVESGRLFRLTLKFCFPFIIITLIVDLVLGLINRFIPALQVFFIGIPIKMWLSIFLFLILINIMTQLICCEILSNFEHFCLVNG